MVPLGLVIIDMEAQHIAIFDGVGDGVGVQLLLKDVLGGFIRRRLAFDLLIAGVFVEDRRAGEAEQLGVGEEFLDGLVVLAELRAVAFVEDEDHALMAQRFQPGQIILLVVAVECQAEFLDGGDDHFVGVVVGEQPLHQCFGIGVFFDALFLKLVKFFPRLPVEIFAIHHEQAFIDIRVVLEQSRCLERGECLTAAGGVPDVTVAAVLVDAIDNVLDGIDLVGAHHQELLLAGHQHHVAADHLAQGALGEKFPGEAVQMGNLVVVFACELVERQAVRRVE